MKNIRVLNKKKLTLEEIKIFYKVNDYKKLYEIIISLINEEFIKPIKSSKLNGKSPALFNSYKVIFEEEDNSKLTNELKYVIDTSLDIAYYLKNINKYKEDREDILLLNKYIQTKYELLKVKIAINERSFEIWGREKFLTKEGGKRILKNLGLSAEKLNVYETTEPLPYYSHNKNTPQNVLIIENKDTFYSMRKHLIKGNNTILGIEISTLIYGGGKNINKTFKDFDYCVEPYLSNKENKIVYLGDLDYEGIIIYESLREVFKDTHYIEVFKEGYINMIDKYLRNDINLPLTKMGQNRNTSNVFLCSFNEEYRNKIMAILKDEKYIPQEILSIGDF